MVQSAEVFDLTTDCPESLDAMVAACGFSRVSGDVYKHLHFVVRDLAKVQFRLFHFDCLLSSECVEANVRQEDKGNPWILSDIAHLLAVRHAFPEKVSGFPVVALGSVVLVEHEFFVPGITDDELELHPYNRFWVKSCRFLAFRLV